MSETGFLRHFVACNNHAPENFSPFYIGSTRYGRLKKEIAKYVLEQTAFFTEHNDGIALAPHLDDFQSRSDALLATTKLLSQKLNKPLRDEMYPVIQKAGDKPVAQLDRLAVPLFGVRAWGIHVNGYVRKNDGLYLWVGERAADRQISPGKLDNLIGGGLPLGLTAEENLCKEAYEEAGVDTALALSSKFIHTISYAIDLPEGVRTDTLFVYDLDLDQAFVPQNMDGEVAAFHLFPLAEVAEIIRSTNRFKFNSAIVIIDFMVRHGFLTQTETQWNEINMWLKKSRA